MAVHSNSFTFRWSVLQIWTRSNLLPISFRVLNRFEYRQEINRQTEKQKKSVSVCLLFFWSVCSGENTKIILASRSASLATRLLLTHSVCVHIKLLCVWERESGWTQERERENQLRLSFHPPIFTTPFAKTSFSNRCFFWQIHRKNFCRQKTKNWPTSRSNRFDVIVEFVSSSFGASYVRSWFCVQDCDFVSSLVTLMSSYQLPFTGFECYIWCVCSFNNVVNERERESERGRERERRSFHLSFHYLFSQHVCNISFAIKTLSGKIIKWKFAFEKLINIAFKM